MLYDLSYKDDAHDDLAYLAPYVGKAATATQDFNYIGILFLKGSLCYINSFERSSTIASLTDNL